MSLCRKRFALPPVAVLFASALLSGCIYHDNSTPNIDGVITHSGKPPAGATITLSTGAAEKQTTKTACHCSATHRD